MSLPPSKHLAVIAAAVFVLAVSLLVLTSSGYDGEDGAEVEVQTTDNLSEAKAAIEKNGFWTYYTSIQGAIDAAENNKDSWVNNGVTVYVIGQTIDQTINIGYVTAQNNSSLSLTIKGISINENSNESISEEIEFDKVDLVKGSQLSGPMFQVYGKLILSEINIDGNKTLVSDTSSAIRVVNENGSVDSAQLELQSSSITNYKGIAIDVIGGHVKVDSESKLNSVVLPGQGVITARSSAVYVYGRTFESQDDSYEIFIQYDRGVTSVGMQTYLYIKSQTEEIDVHLSGDIQESPLLSIKYEENNESSDLSEVQSSIIDVTQDGFPLGTLIVDSAVDPTVVCTDERQGWVYDNSYYYCYLISPEDKDGTQLAITKNEVLVSNQFIEIMKDNKVVFAGITNPEGIVVCPSDLSGIYNLYINGSVCGAAVIVPNTSCTANISGDPVRLEGDIIIRSAESTIYDESVVTSNLMDSTPETITSLLSSRQTIVQSIDITVQGIRSLVFSIELPHGIDPDQAIVFREHSNEIITSRIITNAYGGDASTEVSEFQRGDPYAGSGECFTVESIGGKNYVTIRAEKFSVYALGYESPAPSPPPERTVVNAAIEDRQVRITVGPESYKEYAVRDVEGDLLLGWESGASGLTISFDLLPPGSEYRVMSRYAGTTSEILEATIVAPKDPVIEVVSVWVDGLMLSTEEMVEYRLLLEDGTPVGSWIAGDGEDGSWTDLDPTLDYYAEATSTSDGMTLSTGPVLVKEGVSTEVTGVVKHGGMYLVVSSLDQGWSCSADAEVYSSSGTSVVFGPLAPGTVTLSFTDGEEVRDMNVIVPEMPQDSEDDADTIVIEAQDGVMYRLHDHTGAVVSNGWVDGGGTLTWDVDPLKGYFVTMITGNGDGTVMFPMTEVKRPAEMISPTEGA